MTFLEITQGINSECTERFGIGVIQNLRPKNKYTSKLRSSSRPKEIDKKELKFWQGVFAGRSKLKEREIVDIILGLLKEEYDPTNCTKCINWIYRAVNDGYIRDINEGAAGVHIYVLGAGDYGN